MLNHLHFGLGHKPVSPVFETSPGKSLLHLSKAPGVFVWTVLPGKEAAAAHKSTQSMQLPQSFNRTAHRLDGARASSRPTQTSCTVAVGWLYPCVSFLSAMAGVSSGAHVLLPQMLGPPTGSMPIRLPQDRNRLALVLRGIKCSVMRAAMEPSSAVSLISPAPCLAPLCSLSSHAGLMN